MATNPLYYTTSTAGAAYSPWFPFDTAMTPPSYAWQLMAASSTSNSSGTVITIEVTMDNPWAYGSSIAAGYAGLPQSFSTISPSQLPTAGTGGVGSSRCSVFTVATAQAVANSTTPVLVYPSTASTFGASGPLPGSGLGFYAWRVNTTTSSNAVVVTFLQWGRKQ
jgi:hypothetical protein